MPVARTLKNQLLIPEILKVHQENYSVYDGRKMWHAMRHVGWGIGRDQRDRLAKGVGLVGAHRGRKPIITRDSKIMDDRFDFVNRDFAEATPNRLLVADFT